MGGGCEGQKETEEHRRRDGDQGAFMEEKEELAGNITCLFPKLVILNSEPEHTGEL